jgi:hypothetical protein
MLESLLELICSTFADHDITRPAEFRGRGVSMPNERQAPPWCVWKVFEGSGVRLAMGSHGASTTRRRLRFVERETLRDHGWLETAIFEARAQRFQHRRRGDQVALQGVDANQAA